MNSVRREHRFCGLRDPNSTRLLLPLWQEGNAKKYSLGLCKPRLRKEVRHKFIHLALSPS